MQNAKVGRGLGPPVRPRARDGVSPPPCILCVILPASHPLARSPGVHRGPLSPTVQLLVNFQEFSKIIESYC